MAVSSVRTKHWTRVEYERLIDLGAFRTGERLELVGGALLVREPQGGPHATAVGLVEDALRQVFGTGWTVRTHSPIAPCAHRRGGRVEPGIRSGREGQSLCAGRDCRLLDRQSA